MRKSLVVGQFNCGTRILRVIHGRDARATFETDPLPKAFVLTELDVDNGQTQTSAVYNQGDNQGGWK